VSLTWLVESMLDSMSRKSFAAGGDTLTSPSAHRRAVRDVTPRTCATWTCVNPIFTSAVRNCRGVNVLLRRPVISRAATPPGFRDGSALALRCRLKVWPTLKASATASGTRPPRTNRVRLGAKACCALKRSYAYIIVGTQDHGAANNAEQ
jgi:hypothetical protein